MDDVAFVNWLGMVGGLNSAQRAVALETWQRTETGEPSERPSGEIKFEPSSGDVSVSPVTVVAVSPTWVLLATVGQDRVGQGGCLPIIARHPPRISLTVDPGRGILVLQVDRRVVECDGVGDRGNGCQAQGHEHGANKVSHRGSSSLSRARCPASTPDMGVIHRFDNPGFSNWIYAPLDEMAGSLSLQ